MDCKEDLVVPDRQAAFYTKGYGGKVRPGSEWCAVFEREPAWSRLRRVAAELPGGHALLDIGCGRGGLFYLCRERYRLFAGVDIVEDCVRNAESLASHLGLDHQVKVQNTDTGGLAFSDASFDAVTIVAVLELVFDPIGLLAECWRVLRPGGTLIVQVGNIASLKNRVRMLFGGLPRTTTFQNAVNGGALHFYTAESLRMYIEQAGFDVKKHTCSGRLFHFKARLAPSLVGNDIILVAQRPQ